jgi:hypothetical protein
MYGIGVFMKKIINLMFVAIATLLLSSCVTFKAEGLTYITDVSNAEVLGTFSESKYVNEFLGTPGGSNLFNITSTAMSDKITAIIWKEIQKKGGNGAKDITITYSSTLLSHIANYITVGIWAPAKLKITGTVILTHSNTISADTQRAIDAALADINK